MEQGTRAVREQAKLQRECERLEAGDEQVFT